MQELTKLELEHPELSSEDSPTKRVGGEVVSSFKKVVHEKPMLSLGNVFNETDINNFDERIKKKSNRNMFVNLKLMGLPYRYYMKR